LVYRRSVPDDDIRGARLTYRPLFEAIPGNASSWLDIHYPRAPIPGGRVVVGITVDDHTEGGTRVGIGIPAVVGLETMAIIAEEAGIVVVSLDMVGGEVEAVPHELPIRDQCGHVVIHGKVRIAVYLPADQAQVPPTCVVRVVEIPEVERLWRGDDKEVADTRVLIHVPIGGPGEQDPIVPASTGIVILLRGGREDHSCGAVGVDMKDRHESTLGDPVVDPGSFAPLQHRLGPSV
jgi:hypothetical protein